MTKLHKHKKLIAKNVELQLYLDKVQLKTKYQTHTFNYCDVTSVIAMGKNKLGITTKDANYQIKGDVRFCPVKYVNLYYHFVAQQQNPKPEKEFLGL